MQQSESEGGEGGLLLLIINRLVQSATNKSEGGRVVFYFLSSTGRRCLCSKDPVDRMLDLRGLLGGPALSIMGGGKWVARWARGQRAVCQRSCWGAYKLSMEGLGGGGGERFCVCGREGEAASGTISP